MSKQSGYSVCFLLYIIAHLVGLGALIFVGLWIDYNKTGFGFHEQPQLEFKFHPILMSLTLIFLNGEAIMIYRGLRFCPKYLTKFIHFLLHAISFVFMILGLKAVWDSHDYARNENDELSPIPNLTKPHSWVGLLTAVLYGLQLFVGLIAFYYPSVPERFRKAVMPLHRVSGSAIFVFSLGAALMGTGEKTAYSLHCENPAQICTENLYVNLYSLCLLGYAACVFGIVAIPEWIRVTLPDKQSFNKVVTVINHGSHETNHMSNTAPLTTSGSYKQTQEVFRTSL